MLSADLPVLYSFRRCPYAMRGRLAVQSANFQCQLREIVLRDKAPEMLEASPKGTVPVLVLNDGTVLEESLDVMLHVLGESDPEGWLTAAPLDDMLALIEEADGPFKHHLDRTKYANRYEKDGEAVSVDAERAGAMQFLSKLEAQLGGKPFLFGDVRSLADMAILPFIRQFAHIDIDWFRAQDLPNVIGWLDRFLQSNEFATAMNKYDKWVVGDEVIAFPA